jgi:nitroreductase
MYLKALPVQKKMLVSAPELLLVCFRMRKPLKECKTLFGLNSLASAWACIENVLLAMAAEGLHGVTKIPYETAKLKERLGVPEDYEVAAMIPIGYPQEDYVKQKAVLLKERVHYDRW